MWKLPNAVHLQDKDSTSQSCAFLALTVSGLFGSYTHGKHKIKVIKFSTNFRNFSHFFPFQNCNWRPFSILFYFRHIDTREILYGRTHHQ